MKKFTFKGYFSGASPKYENFIAIAETEKEAKEKINKYLVDLQEDSGNIGHLSDGENYYIKHFRGLELLSTEFI